MTKIYYSFKMSSINFGDLQEDRCYNLKLKKLD